MKLLVYGAGVLGSLFSARMHEAGYDVSLLARGERLAALRRHGVQLAEADSPAVRRVPVPVVEHPAGGYDLIAVFVRTHQVDAVLESLAGLEGDVLFLHSWAAGAQPLGAVIGHERVLLGFPTAGGTMDGDVVRYRATNFMTRRVAMPIGEPDGRATPRLERIVEAFRTAGINAKPERRMDAWLKTHAAFAVPLGQAVQAAGGPVAGQRHEGHAVTGEGTGVEARVAGRRRTDQFVQLHAVRLRQRQQQFQGGFALPGLQAREGAQGDLGRLAQLGQGGFAFPA